jgi:hypothetical protein
MSCRTRSPKGWGSLRDDDDSIRFLLSRSRLSGADHDRILDKILPPSAETRRRRRRLAWGAASLGFAATMALVFKLASRHPAADDRQWLAAKGAATGPLLSVRCPDRAPGQCRPGDKLLFEADGATRGGWLAAYAEDRRGERIWYFPTADGRLAEIPPSDGYSIVREVARIGSEHAPGPYTVHLMMLAHPADRAAVLGSSAHSLADAIVSMQVVPSP